MVRPLSTTARSHAKLAAKLTIDCCLGAVDAFLFVISFCGAVIRIHIIPFLAANPEIVDSVSIGSIAIAALAVVCVKFGRRSSETTASSQDVSEVPGQYNPGVYYTWFFNAVAASYFAPTDKRARLYTNGSTLIVFAYAVAAAIDQLRMIIDPGLYSDAIIHASDRVNMVSWSITTLYLLRKFSQHRVAISPRGRLFTVQSVVWMATWLSNSAAMLAINIIRGDIKARIYLFFLPIMLGIVFPLSIMHVLHSLGRLPWASSTWIAKTINLCATLSLFVYVLIPRSLRYDPDSPTAPLGSAKMSNGAQIIALAGLAPLVLFLWYRMVSLWKNSRAGSKEPQGVNATELLVQAQSTFGMTNN